VKSFKNIGSMVGWLMVVVVAAAFMVALPVHAHAFDAVSLTSNFASNGWGHIAMLGVIPSLAQVKQFSTTGGGLEGIRQALYDHLLYPTAGQNQFNFFSAQRGQGMTSAVGAVVASPKSIADTNLDVSGMLPSGKAFAATSVEVSFYAGSVATANTYTLAPPAGYLAQAAATVVAQVNDVNSFYQSGSLQLYIAAKVVLEEAPLMRFPPKCFLNLDASVAQAGTNATNAALWALSAKASGRPYMLEPLIYIEPNVNFLVALNFPAAVATPSGFNARVGVILDGYQYRLA
jgi:hypothetical protein